LVPSSPFHNPTDRVVHLAGGLEQERELTPEEAERAPDRVSRHYAGDRLVRLEVVRDGITRLVRYLERQWPDEALLAQHRREHGELPFEVLSPTERTVGGGRRRRVWSVRADGTTGEIAEHELDDAGEILAEERFTPDGVRFARTEYEYDDGDLVMTRELDADGKVVSEWES
jgi:hypothetical protein